MELFKLVYCILQLHIKITHLLFKMQTFILIWLFVQY
jgi:hypothetical protein